MLLGTQILSWQVAVLLPLAAVASGLYAARKRTPSSYKAAQIVDRSLGLSDTLSTGFYFAENASAPVSAEVRRLQWESAERTASSIDVKQAIPYTMPRSAYAMAALALVATSLFGLRYGLTHSLDLQPPLAHILQQTFGKDERVEQANNRRRTPKQDPASPDENQALTDEEQKDGSGQQPNQPEGGQEANDQADAGKSADKGMDDNKSDVAEPAEDGDKSAQSDEQQGNNDDGKSGQSGDPKADASKEGGKNDSNNSNNESNSLFNKVKDFAQNLLSKVKSPQGGQQKSVEQQSKQGKGDQAGAKQQSKDGQKQDGQQGDPQEGQAGDQADNSQDPDGKGTGKNDSKQSSNQPGSGMGSQDGDKRIKQAEQLAAMGKISEIIGKRSQTVTGEATVEVKSTSQQIRTPYAQRGSQHSQGGTEINRDEVPVAVQSYVEHYFEQVRKQTPAPKK